MQRWTALDWAGGNIESIHSTVHSSTAAVDSVARCEYAGHRQQVPYMDGGGSELFSLYTLSAALVLCCDHDPSHCKYLKLHIFTMGETCG